MNAIAALFRRKTILVGVALGIAVAVLLHAVANALTPLTRQTLRLLRSTLPTTISLDAQWMDADEFRLS